ncbi:MAG: cation:proton antiporter [Amnibacterium sp.]
MIDTSTLVIAGLAVIVLVAALSHRTGIASPLVLLVVGVAAGYLPFVPAIAIPHEWILAGVLPLLLYASAVNLPATDFRRNIVPITGLSVVLVVLSTLATGLLLMLVFPRIGLFAALAVGAVVSPTDAVAATAIARRLGLPERTITVLEGESLVNDASALTLLRAFTAAAAAGTVNPAAIGGQFAYSVLLASAVGLVVGWGTVELRARLSDPVLTTTVSFVVPFVAFVPADRLGASGVLAAVVAGLLTGARGAHRFDASQRVSDHTNWRTVQFVLEHAVFLAMGLELKTFVAQVGRSTNTLAQAVEAGLAVTVALLAVRTVYVAVELPVLRRWERRALHRADALKERAERLERYDPEDDRKAERKERAERSVAQRRADLRFLAQNGLSWRGAAVVSWSGMRGVVTLAAAQSLPDEFPLRPLLVLVAFTVAVVTLLGFGGTLPFVIRLTGIQGTDRRARRDEVRDLLDQVNRSSLRVLDDDDLRRVRGQEPDPQVLESLRSRYGYRSESDDAEQAEGRPDDGIRDQFLVLRRRMRQAAREELLDARSVGRYSTRAIRTAQEILDLSDAREDRIADTL